MIISDNALLAFERTPPPFTQSSIRRTAATCGNRTCADYPSGSFALSIVLFLSFSVMIDFANYLMPQSAGTSDIDITLITSS